MASLKLHLSLTLLVLAHALVIFPSPVTSDEEDKLLQRINSYRMSLRQSALADNDQADCLADQIADQLENRPCPVTITPTMPEAQFSNYPKPLDKCHLSINNTRDGAILLSCQTGRVKSLTAFNFTDPIYSRYLNDSKYMGAGIGSEDDWIVVVLTSNTPSGSFVAAASDAVCLVFNLVTLVMGSLMVWLAGACV